MASTKLYLDQRNKKAAVFPVVVSVSANNKTLLIPTGLKLSPEEWSGDAVVKRSDKARLNTSLRSFRAAVDNVLLSLSMAGKLRSMQPADIKAEIMRTLSPESYQETPAETFATIYDKFLETKTGRTRELYTNTRAKIAAFCRLQSLTFEAITPAWLDDFVAHLRACNNKVNTIGIELRNIRAVFNYARKHGATKEYPFLNYPIQREKTRKRNNKAEILCILKHWPVEPHQAKYRDTYLLMFYLLGINIIDLCFARWENIIDGRLEYTRAKTHKLYSVWIPPEAWEIINRYRGREYVLEFMDGRASYKSFAKALNENLQQIGWVRREGRGGKKIHTPLLPDNTAYWARHSWATIAHKVGIEKDVISMALGHSFGADVTDVYIDYDAEKVDAANRRVLDYLAEIEQSEDFNDNLESLVMLGTLV